MTYPGSTTYPGPTTYPGIPAGGGSIPDTYYDLYGAYGVSASSEMSVTARPAGWRYLAKQVLGGPMLELDLPIAREELRWDLSGAGVLRGTIAPEYAQLAWANGVPVLGEWATELYAELDGHLRWGGILVKSGFRGGEWGLEAYGFTGYASDVPYLGAQYSHVSRDPTQIFADIWAYLQGQPDSALGLTVVRPTSCPVRVGTTEEPYTLMWWEAQDCGSELAALAAETPFDFTETHAWTDATSTAMAHSVTVHYPRAGRRRTDLVFNPDNLAAVVELERDGTVFANALYVFGKGEGAKTVHSESVERDGRLRRAKVHTDKLAGTTVRTSAIANAERRRRGLALALASITVNDHPNARIGSWALGDDITVTATLPHVGQVSLAHRVMGWSLGRSDTQATLHLQRSETFRYGAGP